MADRQTTCRGPWKYVIFDTTYTSFSRTAATLVIKALDRAMKRQDLVVFVPSAGRTPRLMYKLLATTHRDTIDWKRVIVIQMDEYWGIPCNHPLSQAFYIEKHLVEPLGIAHYMTFFDEKGALVQNLDDIDSFIKTSGGIDVIVHGIGRNGHIGFNEPGSAWTSPTRMVNLRDSTIRANFGESFLLKDFILRKAVTLGLGSLTLARHAILLLSGKDKNTIAERFFTEDPNVDLPASSLSLNNLAEILVNLSSFSPQVRNTMQKAS